MTLVSIQKILYMSMYYKVNLISWEGWGGEGKEEVWRNEADETAG